MPSTIRISSTTHRSLAQIAEETNSSLQETLDRAIENERRRLLPEQTNRAYAKLRQNKKAWKDFFNAGPADLVVVLPLRSTQRDIPYM